MSSVRLQAGGTLQQDAIYLERAADRELITALGQGEYCFILGPRQIGKSSLLARARQHLMTQGSRSVVIDLTALGVREIRPEEWYFGLIDVIAQALELREPLEYWEQHRALSPVQRFSRYLLDEVVSQIKEPIVLFIDEIDSVLSLPFPMDDFFAVIRAVFNSRALIPAHERLTFCIVGVASPAELMRDVARTPFNIGRSIHLSDFTKEEARALLPALAVLGEDPGPWLDEVFGWTDGHPYMTQRLCLAIIEQGAGNGSADQRVAQIAEGVFLHRGRVDDPNLAYAERRLRRHPDNGPMLRVYRRLLTGGPIALSGSADGLQMELQLTGMIKEIRESGRVYLKVRNRIYSTVFDLSWLKENEDTRRFTAQLDRWLDSGKKDEFLLRGDDLHDMVTWMEGRTDVAPEESEFAAASVRSIERRLNDLLILVERDVEQIQNEMASNRLIRILSSVSSARWLELGIIGSIGSLTAIATLLIGAGWATLGSVLLGSELLIMCGFVLVFLVQARSRKRNLDKVSRQLAALKREVKLYETVPRLVAQPVADEQNLTVKI